MNSYLLITSVSFLCGRNGSMSDGDHGLSLPPIASAIAAAALGTPVHRSPASSGAAYASQTGPPPSQPELLSSLASGTGSSGNNNDPSTASLQRFADLAVQNLAGTFVSLLQAFHKQNNRNAYIETRVSSQPCAPAPAASPPHLWYATASDRCKAR
jgi:hypothetical protein